MKRKLLLAFVSLGILSSCNNDDNNDGGSSSGSIAGTYKLTAFNISAPQDLNNDGTPSVNQMNETACFNNSFMTLNADNTFVYDDKGLDIVTDGVNELIECYDDGDVTGTWSKSGNVLTLTYTFDGDSYSDDYTVSGSTITLMVENGSVVGTTSAGDPVYVTADFSAVYTKQ